MASTYWGSKNNTSSKVHMENEPPMTSSDVSSRPLSRPLSHRCWELSAFAPRHYGHFHQPVQGFPRFFFFGGSGWQDGWWVVDGPLMTYRIWWPGLDVYCGTNDLCHTTWWYMMYIVKYIYNHIHAILDPTTLGMFKLTLIWTAPARWSFWKSWRIYNLKREGWWFKSGRTGRSQAPQHTQTDS